MTKNRLKLLIISAFLVIVVCCTQMQQPGNNSNNMTAGNVGTTPTPFPACPASGDWLNNPQSGPSEIALGTNAELCQFYQFSWQWFLAMMNTPTGGTTRNYQNQQQYPQFNPAINSCAAPTDAKPRLFVRVPKDDDNANDFVLPEDIKQAGGGAVIYDQNGNVVLYEVRFSRNECTLAETNPTAANFPAGTIELKISYRIVSQQEAPNYVSLNADINGDGTEELLGMVGFHLVISTPLHPEFIWATFEHKLNAPECQTTPDPNAKWSFTSAKCASALPNPANSDCAFNMASPPTPTPTPTSPTPGTTSGLPTGVPTQVCRVYHDGSKPGDHGYDMNVFDIDTLNTQMTNMLTPLSSGPLAVLKNYQLVGALWVNQSPNPAPAPSPPYASVLANQRGSIQLTNSTMETTHQMGFTPVAYTGTTNLLPAANCFACHGYDPTKGNVAQSHIYDKIFGQTKKN